MSPELKVTSKSQILLTAGVLLTLLNTIILLGIIGFSLYQSNANKDNEGKLVLAGINAEEAAQLNSQLSYTGTKSEETEYYSPTLDLLVKYDSTQLYLSDGTESIFVMPKNSGSSVLSANIKILSKTSNDPISNRSAYYESLYDGVKKDEEGTVEGLSYAKISYAQEDLLDSTKKTIVTKLIVYREIDNKYLYAELSYPSGYDISSITTLLADILNSADLEPEGIAENIEVKLKEPGVEFAYNKDMWKVNSVTDASASLEFRSSEFEEEVDLKSGYTSVYMSAYLPTGDESVQADHDELVSYGEESHADEEDDFEFIHQSQEVEIGGVKFIYTEYSYYSFGTYFKGLYTGKTPSGYILHINTLMSHPDSVAADEIDKMFESFTFTEESKVSLNAQGETNGNVLGTSSIEIDKSAIIGKPAVVHIFNRTCVEIDFAQTELLPTVSGNSYDVCMAYFGSGFFVSKEGYIVTNGHVATPSGIDSVMDSFWYDLPANTPFWNGFLTDLQSLVQASGTDLSAYGTDEVFAIVMGFFVGLVDEGTATITTTNSPYIEKSVPFALDFSTLSVTNSADLTAVEVVDGKVGSRYKAIYDLLVGDSASAGISIPDLAILKVNATEVEEYPALGLYNHELLTSGQKIVVIGFPGSADNKSLFSESASRIPTITNGVVSAIKPNSTGTFNLLQIDASISGGNSGGPILDSNGDVVGVATYGLPDEGGADFNAGVSVEEVEKFLSENSITLSQSSVSASIESGIENMDKQYYKLAVADFTDATDKYPLSGEILNPLIAISNDKIASGEDKTPAFNLTSVEDFLSGMGLNVSGGQTIGLLIAAVGLILSSTLVVILLIRKQRQNAGFKPPVVGNQSVPVNEPVTPVPPAAPTTTPVTPQDPMVQQTPPVVGDPNIQTQMPQPPQPTTVTATPMESPSKIPAQPQPPIQTQLTTPAPATPPADETTPAPQPPQPVQPPIYP